MTSPRPACNSMTTADFAFVIAAMSDGHSRWGRSREGRKGEVREGEKGVTVAGSGGASLVEGVDHSVKFGR